MVIRIAQPFINWVKREELCWATGKKTVRRFWQFSQIKVLIPSNYESGDIDQPLFTILICLTLTIKLVYPSIESFTTEIELKFLTRWQLNHFTDFNPDKTVHCILLAL